MGPGCRAGGILVSRAVRFPPRVRTLKQAPSRARPDSREAAGVVAMNGTRAALAVAFLLGAGVPGAWGQGEKPKAARPPAVRAALVARQAGPAALAVLDLAYAGLAEE